ncbi:MAG TPA: hypothetical protein VFZ09_34160 [Archangium sp.]|uniref:hypothetical protein n=1 Tax=Archangium sp. TaxID=1872627 RepID=UPI002E319C94|nr:hypothetical protein [Archangium sp.]HEX5751319.1 hypothetical protein [Archangium sp.]
MRTKTLALLLAVLLCACVGDANSKGELELETATTPLTMTKDVLVYSEVTDPLTGDVAFTDLLSLEPAPLH